MQIDVTIASHHKAFLGEIFNEPTIADARPIMLTDGVAIKGEEWGFQKGGDFPNIVTVLLTAALTVPTTVIANVFTGWLMRNRHHIERVNLKRIEIQLDDAERVRAIVLEIVSTERQSR